MAADLHSQTLATLEEAWILPTTFKKRPTTKPKLTMNQIKHSVFGDDYPSMHRRTSLEMFTGPLLSQRQTDRHGKQGKELHRVFLLHFTSPYSQSSSALEEQFAQILSSCFLLLWPSEEPRYNATVIYARFLLMVVGPFRFNICICLKSLLLLLSSE